MNGVASGTRLHFPDADAPPDRVDAFGKSLVALVDRDHPEKPLLLLKPTKRVSHGGGLRIQPGSREESTLMAWIQVLAAMPQDQITEALRYNAKTFADMHSAEGAAVRRLTHSQYNHTVHDLLEDETRPADAFLRTIS